VLEVQKTLYQNQGIDCFSYFFNSYIDLIVLRSSNSSRYTQSKRIGKETITPAPKNIDPPVTYHPWKLEYSRVFIRENKQKPMTKDRYRSTRPSVAHAKESIVTEEECCPVLISANAVHIEQPIIIHQQRAKSACKFISSIYCLILN
jgi:hypothetical protein